MHIVHTTAKYQRMSKRRQKRMLTKMKATIFTNVYPVSVGEPKVNETWPLSSGQLLEAKDEFTVEISFAYSGLYSVNMERPYFQKPERASRELTSSFVVRNGAFV